VGGLLLHARHVHVAHVVALVVAVIVAVMRAGRCGGGGSTACRHAIGLTMLVP
jgi:hypothetical protein